MRQPSCGCPSIAASAMRAFACAALLLTIDARAGDFLGAAELKSLIVGNTVSFHNLVTGWKSRSYFDPDGTVATGDEHLVFARRWRIGDDGMLCVATGERETCVRVERGSKGTYTIVWNGQRVRTWLAVATGRPTSGFASVWSRIVLFDSLTFPGSLYKPFLPPREQGMAVRIGGILTLPPGADQVPAVVLTHGCGGISIAQRAWAGTLLRFGVATLIVDSFRGRGIREICTGKQSVNVASVLTDAFRALDYLAAEPRVDSSRIAILGASYGGRTALWSANERIRQRYSRGKARFAAHLAFYPANCYLTLADEAEVGAAPIRIFHGTADDWIPLAGCKAYVERLRRAGRNVALLEYAGARHSFDLPGTGSVNSWPQALNPTHCAFVERDGKIVDAATGNEFSLDAKCVSRGATTGYDAAAHRQAIEDVRTFLGVQFGLH